MKESKEKIVNSIGKEKKNHDGAKKISKKTVRIIAALVIVIILILIGITAYFKIMGNSKRIVGNSIVSMSNDLKSLANQEEIEIGDDYTVSSNMKINVTSDYLSYLDPQYSTIISNINQMNHEFYIVQNRKDEKLFANIHSTLGGSDFIDVKYLIQDKTEYYFIKDFLSTYIKGNENDYFDTLDEDTTSRENISYIYDYAIASFKNNLKDSYFKKSTVTTMLHGKEKKVTKVTLHIDNKVAREIAEAVLNDLKKDTKASNILTNINEDFRDVKVDSDVPIFEDGEYIDYIVYADKLTFNVDKYQLDIVSDDDINSIVYEDNDDGKEIELWSGHEVKSYITVNQKEEDITKIKLYDSSKKSIGTVSITKKDKDYSITFKIEIDDVLLKMNAKSSIKTVKEKEEYQAQSSVDVSISSEGLSMGKIEIEASSEITNKATDINEDVSNAVAQNEITEDQKQQFQEKLYSILSSLMS